MINPQIVKYIADERARGVIDADIKKALLEKGWRGDDVENAFKTQGLFIHGVGLFKGRLDKGNFLKIVLVGIVLQLGISFLVMGMGGVMGYRGMMLDSGSFGTALVAALIMFIVGVVIAIYGIGATVRRLHDIGQTGWYALAIFLLSLIPFLGVLIQLGAFIYLCIQPGDSKENIYGGVPNPNITLWQAITGKA